MIARLHSWKKLGGAASYWDSKRARLVSLTLSASTPLIIFSMVFGRKVIRQATSTGCRSQHQMPLIVPMEGDLLRYDTASRLLLIYHTIRPRTQNTFFPIQQQESQAHQQPHMMLDSRCRGLATAELHDTLTIYPGLQHDMAPTCTSCRRLV